MKTWIVLMLVCLGAAQGFSQTIPNNAKADFAKRFPNATGSRWEKEGKLYEVGFKDAGRTCSAEYDLQGKWITTEQHVAVAELPKELTDALKAKYKNATLLAAETVQKGSAPLQYEILIQQDGKKSELLADAKGNVSKTVHEKANGSGDEGSADDGSDDDGSGDEGSADESK